VLNALRDKRRASRAARLGSGRWLANAVHGVTLGFKKELDIVGVGYRAELKGKHVSFGPGQVTPDRISNPRGDSDYR